MTIAAIPNVPKINLDQLLLRVQPVDALIQAGSGTLARLIQDAENGWASHAGTFLSVGWAQGVPAPIPTSDPGAIISIGECSASEPPDMLSQHSNWGFSIIEVTPRLSGETVRCFHLPLRTPATPDQQAAEARWWIEKDATHPGYGLFDLPAFDIYLHLKEWFPLVPWPAPHGGLVCSTSVMSAKCASGQILASDRPGYDPDSATPQDVVNDPLFDISMMTEILA